MVVKIDNISWDEFKELVAKALERYQKGRCSRQMLINKLMFLGFTEKEANAEADLIDQGD